MTIKQHQRLLRYGCSFCAALLPANWLLMPRNWFSSEEIKQGIPGRLEMSALLKGRRQ